jgi:hypothetical protein
MRLTDLKLVQSLKNDLDRAQSAYDRLLKLREGGMVQLPAFAEYAGGDQLNVTVAIEYQSMDKVIAAALGHVQTIKRQLEGLGVDV